MGAPQTRIGLTACMFHPDPTRDLFKGKRLLYMEESMFHWVAREGGLPYLLPTAPKGGPALADFIDDLDGVLLSGGVDVAPWPGARRQSGQR